MKMMKFNFTCFILTLSLVYSQAQTNLLNDSLHVAMEDIVISANRLEIPLKENARNIQIIDKTQINIINPGSINELLQTVAGIDLRQRGANGVQGDLSIRGGTFEQSLVLINGVRLTDPQTGHHLMNLPFSVNDIERIEVIKGPGARVYGQNAFAGAINIVTKVANDFELKAFAEYGEYDLANSNVQLSLPLGNYLQTISGTYHKSSGYRYNSDYDIKHLFYQSKLETKKGDFELLAGHVDRDFGANGFYGREDFTEQFETIQTSFASLSYNHYFGKWKILPRLSYRKNTDNWQFMRSDPEFFQNFHTSKVLSGELHSKLDHALGQFGIGIEFNKQSLESSNLKDSLDNGMHNRKQSSIYLENQFKLLAGKLQIIPGITLLNISDYGSSVYPGLDVGYQLSQALRSFANIGWSTRIPSFTDLYYKDAGNEGNPNLTEENAFSFELGLKYEKNLASIQMSYFQRNAFDQIDWFREMEEDKWMPDNFNTANYRGFDLDLGIKPHLPLLSYLKMGYSYIDATFEDNGFAFSRNQLENLKHQFVLQFNLSFGQLGLNTIFKYNNRVSLENYYTLSSQLSYSFPSFSLFAKANNISDQIYRETNLVDMPGRWISAGFRYELN